MTLGGGIISTFAEVSESAHLNTTLILYFSFFTAMRLSNALRHIPAWTISALWLGLILWLTLAPSPVGDVDVPLFPGIDKVVHGVLFGVLTLAICYDTAKWRGGIKRLRAFTPWVAAAISGLTGIVIEILQLAMSLGRSFEDADIAADFGGAFLAAIAFSLFLRSTRRS